MNYTLIFAKSPLGWETVTTFSLVGGTIYLRVIWAIAMALRKMPKDVVPHSLPLAAIADIAEMVRFTTRELGTMQC